MTFEMTRIKVYKVVLLTEPIMEVNIVKIMVINNTLVMPMNKPITTQERQEDIR